MRTWMYQLQLRLASITDFFSQPEVVDAIKNSQTSVPATNISVAADATNGVSAGNLQTTISALAARIKALESA